MPLYIYVKEEIREDTASRQLFLSFKKEKATAGAGDNDFLTVIWRDAQRRFKNTFANLGSFFKEFSDKPKLAFLPNRERSPIFLTRKRIVSLSLISLGLFLLGNGIFPLVYYQLKYAPRFSPILSPVVGNNNRLSSLFEAEAQEGTADFTLVSSWFKEEAIKESSVQEQPLVTQYGLSVPKIGIINAKVLINSDDLKKSLVHLKGTALPGQRGNAVVSGHSVSPQFFNPKIYMTIFSNLFKLKEGDEILIDFDGIEYHYFVEDIFETKPTDLSVIEQRFDAKYLTLITCPMGDYNKRLIVKAKLI